MERDDRQALDRRMETNHKKARHANRAIRTGRTHTGQGEVYLVRGQRQPRRRDLFGL